VNRLDNERSDITKNTRKKSNKREGKDTTEKKWMRNCPECGKGLFYKHKHGRNEAEKIGRWCRSCRNSGKNNPFYGKQHTEEHKQYMSELSPSSRPEVRKKISDYNKGKQISKRTKEKLRQSAIKQFSTPEAREAASRIRKKYFKNNPESKKLFQQKAIEQWERFRETDEYHEWKDAQPEYKLYKMEVLRITLENDLSVLDNYSKKNLYHGYELDHIFPIREGFLYNVPPELIGGLGNLRIIPMTENRRKSNKIIEEIIPEHLQQFLD